MTMRKMLQEVNDALDDLTEQFSGEVAASDLASHTKKGFLDELRDLQDDARSLMADWDARPEPEPEAAHLSRDGFLHQKFYVFPLLRILKRGGGTLETKRALDRLHCIARERLTHRDYHKTAQGESLWRNRAGWVRKLMVDEGLLRSDSPTGYWEITQVGIDELERGDIDQTWRKLRSTN